jgi:hypothetical protein
MSRGEKKLKLSDEKFKRRIGTTKPVFQTMLTILQAAYDKLHIPGGKPPDLTVGDKLLITLKYYREYVTVESIADDYDCSKSAVCRTIHWVEDVLYRAREQIGLKLLPWRGKLQTHGSRERNEV